jgi:excisionase family DNA binding protein
VRQDDDDDLLTTRELAAEFRVSPRTVERWIRGGEIPAARIGRRLWVRRRDVRRFISRHTSGQDDP